MQQILVQIMDAAHPGWAEDATNRTHVPWLEERSVDNPSRERPDPRIFGSHLPPDMLPRGVKANRIKVIYIYTVAQNEHFDKELKEKMSNLALTCVWEIKE